MDARQILSEALRLSEAERAALEQAKEARLAHMRSA
jgi:hypothetical protein